jgi:hypothetical protein
MPEFTENQLNALAEELFESRAASQETTQLAPEAQEEIQAEAAKSLAKDKNDPLVPKQMTRQVWKQMMRIHFTVRRGLAQPCGHKLSTTTVLDDKGKQSVFITADPRKNCSSCWFTYFNTNGQMTQIADECFQNAGRDVLERSRGKKFVKYFLMFMSTVARFQREAAERATKEKSNGVEIESTGSAGGDSTTDSGIGGVVGEAQSIGGVYSDPSFCPEGSVDEGSTEGFGIGIGSMRQGLGDEAQSD